MTIYPLNDDNFEEVLGLIGEYQRFYNVKDVCQKRNRDFFSQFKNQNKKGAIHCLNVKGTTVGFSTVYFCFSSTLAKPIGVLNDLYVSEAYRQQGYGKALIDHAVEYLRSLGIERMQWLTAADNSLAQSLYDSLPATKSKWYFYAMATGKNE